jgi:soluble lytic murein transglycosylase-like protein
VARRRRPSRSGRARGWRARRIAAILLGLAACVGVVAIWQWKSLVWAAREYSAVRRVESFAEILHAAAFEADLDVHLLAGLMMVESRGNVGAKSSKGALGLFQLMPATAAERAALLDLREPSKRDLLSNAALNTRLGAHHLAWLLKRYKGNEEAALVAYNTGSGRLDRWIREAGSYAAWRAERERAGNSDVLPYAQRVLRYRDRFAARGNLLTGPRLDTPPPGPFVGPPEPTDSDDEERSPDPPAPRAGD